MMNPNQKILSDIDWPTDIILLDFETYYDVEYSLEKMSTIEYITDDRFEFTGLGIQINDELPVFIDGPRVPWAIKRLKSRYGKALHNCTVVAKNNKFDVTILAEKFGIFPPYAIDIEDLSRYYDSRMKQDLKSLAKTFKLPAKGETSQFKGLHWNDLVRAEQFKSGLINPPISEGEKLERQAIRTDMKEYCLRDIEDEKSLLDLLLSYIDNPARELALAQHTLNLYLKPSLLLDADMASQIKVEMDTKLSDDLKKVSWILSDFATKTKQTVPEILRARNIFPKILQSILPEGETVPMKDGKKGVIPALAKQDIGFQLLLTHPNEKVRNLCKAKAACTSWPLHQSKVEHMINQTRCSNSKLRIPLKYYGAHTGRWSGTEKWNPLNLGGKGRGAPIHPLIAKVRNTIMAPDGYVLIISDSAQIEARELAWIAGQNDLVKGFANGEDIYSVFATRLFGEKVRKPKETDSPEQSKLLSIRRGFGKDAILGCGYGMGTNTFFDRCRQNESLRPLFDSGEYDWDFIDRLIKTYRTTYKRIPAFWKSIEDCFRIVTKYPGEVREYYIKGEDIQYNGNKLEYNISLNPILTFWKEGSTTIIQLPSERRLFYRHATYNTKKKELKYLHGPLWGGTLTENVIQAICRDLLAGWLLECEANGIPIVLHTYDELVGCVPEESAEEKLEQMNRIMCTGPDWSAGLPLAAEGQISRRYCK